MAVWRVMQALWRHIEYNYREGGIRQILFKVWSRLQQWAWSDSAWLVYQIDLSNYRLDAALPLSGSVLDFDSLRDLGYFKVFSFPESVQSRLDSGARCNGFFLDGELVTIAWTSYDCLEIEPGVSIREDKCVGIFDCLTMTAHRSRGFYTEALIRLAAAAREEGGRVILIAVDPGNRPSIKGIERAGFKPLYKLTRRRRFGRCALRRSEFQPGFEGPI